MNPLRVLGYARCSTQEQAQGLSIEVQVRRIASWCEAQEADLVDVVEDAAVSGTKRLECRAGGSRIAALLDAREPGIDAVAVVRLDRLGRDAAETLTLLRRFTTGKVGLVSLRDRLDLTTPQGRAMAGVAAVFGQLERELIGQRTADALGQLRTTGKVYGPVPFGFLRDGDSLVPDDQEQSVVATILDLRGQQKSYRAIAAYLNAEAVPAKRGGTWSAMSVRSVLLTTDRLSRSQ